MTVKLVIEPIFEADFCENSYGFRPKKSAHDAVDDVAHTMNKGYTEVIDADLSKYFDTIPHANLMRVIAERISDSGILHMIQMWLKAPVMEVDKNGKKKTSEAGKGTGKGHPREKSSPHYCPICICIFWIEHGRKINFRTVWEHASSAMRTIL